MNLDLIEPLFTFERSIRAGDPIAESVARSQLRQRAADIRAYCVEVGSVRDVIPAGGSELLLDDQRILPSTISGRFLHELDVALANAAVWSDSILASGARLHADYSLLRSMVEALCTCVWLVGPSDSNTRLQRLADLNARELKDFRFYVQRLSRIKPDYGVTQRKYLNGLLAAKQTSLDALASAGLTAGDAGRASFSRISEEAGKYLDNLDSLAAYSLWAVCSGFVHGDPLYAEHSADREIFVGYNDVTKISDEASSFHQLGFVDGIWEMLVVAVRFYNQRGS